MSKSWAERLEEGNQLIAEHKAKMAAEYGVEGHPKFERCYELAWAHGHPSGFGEVELYFSDFVTLIK